MQKNYELLYIVHPDLEGSTEKVTEKVSGFIKKAEGEVTSQEDWGKRKLAYTLAKNDFGVYVLVNFTIDSMKLQEVERDLRLSEEILRSMIVVVPEVKEIVTKPKKEKAEAKEEKTEAPASIIVSDEKPAKKVTKKAEPKIKKDSPSTDAQDEVKTSKKAVIKKTAKKTVANGELVESTEVDEAERLKKLDEKLDELLGE